VRRISLRCHSEDALKPLVARLAVHGHAVVPIRTRGTVNVARHGMIRAETEPDRGAAFYFTLQAPVTGRAASRRSPS
jgi:hypothetical protein